MTKKKIIDIDAEFDGVEFDEKAIIKATQYAKSADKHRGQKRSAEQRANMSAWQTGKAKSEKTKVKIGDAMRGKTLEEIVGVEAAAKGRKARSEASKGKKRPVEVIQKIAATRKANGSYQSDTHGMSGKEHKESTKATMQIKAKIRQDLRRKLNMGKSGTVPKELLEAEYKKAGLK